MKILIKNGLIVNADSQLEADVFCKNGKIIKIGKDFDPDWVPDKTIDAKGCYLFPGGIDPHVHLHLPTPAGFSSDNFLSGSKAALHGGTTTIIDFVTPKKGQSLKKALELRKAESSDCLTDYSFHVSPIEWNAGMEQEILDCLGKENLRSFKVYLAYKDSIGIEDDELLQVMIAVAKGGGMVTVHCELGDNIEELRSEFIKEKKVSPKYHPLSRPAQLESDAVRKAIDLAKQTNCPLYIVHVSSKESLKYIEEAQKEGQEVFGETCPHYLVLDDSKYSGNFQQTAPFVMSPPLRKKDDNKALWEGLSNKSLQTIGTDHCPFSLEQKERGITDFTKIPNGAGGIEHRLSILFTYGVLAGKLSLNEFVALCSTNSAKIFGMYPAKGIIAEGADADIVIWNPERENTISAKSHHQNCDINIYEDIKTVGEPVFVISGGNIAIENGTLNNIPKGRFLKTNPL